MFAVDTASSTSSLPFTTKSTLQALLRSREQTSVQKKKLFVAEPEQESFTLADTHNIQTPPANSCVFPASGSENLIGDHNGDFSYSQKLFHIADGNLYSIFSPLQGRSYGMKPSFLRKQRCTVQECQGKGRRVLRKGLKFHNFLPSESVTSEKDGGHLQDQWRVHSECKLREEHGTKQIMVSNWFQNVRPSDEESSKPDSSSACEPQVSPLENGCTTLGNQIISTDLSEVLFDSDLISQNQLPSALHESSQETTQQDLLPVSTEDSSGCELKSPTRKKGFLNSLLQSVSTNQVSSAHSSKQSSTTADYAHYSSQKHRRKPNQTRRVVPYTKYLSIIEENETHPLDLSMHNKKNSQDEVEHKEHVSAVSQSGATFQDSVELYDASPLQNGKYDPPPKLIPISQSDFLIPPAFQVPQYICNIPVNGHIPVLPPVSLDRHKQSAPKLEQNVHNLLQFKLRNSQERLKARSSSSHVDSSNGHRSSSNNHSMVPSVSSSARSSRPRRKSQRSVIKQKLEDTFRQNGFLVKTKQVSDGEATFCKFRQLRKYTRYYLKSWQHHLPDEVHKMWKGFLPPKTVLPPTSGCSQSSADDNC